ncbi:MAG TPA: TMEM165/GDT1 family protein [Desulfonatronum sp.]|nr:TMEM165/GDT1 family protein [Desulfonatronum sp.]
MDWKLAMVTFGIIFLAELGDKTQLACIFMAAKTEKPWSVFMGASLGLVSVSLLGVLLAQVLCQYLPVDLIKKAAAVAFVIVGVLIFMDKI